MVAHALLVYVFPTSPRDPRLQAAALRLAAERVERGEALAPELADALATDMARHPRIWQPSRRMRALSRSG